jgi:hypothetical protein
VYLLPWSVSAGGFLIVIKRHRGQNAMSFGPQLTTGFEEQKQAKANKETLGK